MGNQEIISVSFCGGLFLSAILFKMFSASLPAGRQVCAFAGGKSVAKY
jgi:hypothetical protein